MGEDVGSTLVHHLRDVDWTVDADIKSDGTEHCLRLQLPGQNRTCSALKLLMADKLEALQIPLVYLQWFQL